MSISDISLITMIHFASNCMHQSNFHFLQVVGRDNILLRWAMLIKTGAMIEREESL